MTKRAARVKSHRRAINDGSARCPVSGARRNLDAHSGMGEKPHMTGAQAITGLYLLAALAALVAAFYWFQLVKVHSAQAYKGVPVTWRHLPQAAAFTGFTMVLAAIGFIASVA